jgi:SAM-dependent methyltransferase
MIRRVGYRSRSFRHVRQLKPTPARTARRDPTWSERGSAAVDLGDLHAAKLCFAQAVRAEPGDAQHRYHLALVQQGLGEPGAAARSLTEALRLDPSMADAARRLALLAGRFELPAALPLDAAGLKAALAYDTVDRELIAEVAMRHLERDASLGGALGKGRAGGWTETARSLCVERTGLLLKDDLFLQVLRTGLFRNPDVERLLTALRRTLLLEVVPERFEDRALVDFALALMHQCWINEHVWAVETDEARTLAQLGLGMSEALAGDLAAGRKFLLASLYQPISRLLGEAVEPRQAAGIRPRALREAVVAHLAEAADERGRAARLPRLGAVADRTSLAVAAQYEANPYPRWTSVGLVRPADMRRTLGAYFKAGELAFLDRPFEVLIAGCGTGQQAVQAALAYGPAARVLAVDLSAASLAYAQRMAERFGAGNITFAQADLLTLDRLGPQFAGRFDVIECTGVLHHLADPFQGWRALLDGLAEDGRMFVGLYSAIARRNLSTLRRDPAYPGPGCSDQALSVFRKVLLDRPDGAPGSELKASRDFYAASNFRDLALHVSERCLTLPEIARFLADSGLAFRGFQIDRGVFRRLQERFPGEAWPGALERWAEFEAENPHTFAAMYNFWCVPTHSGQGDDTADRSFRHSIQDNNY